MPNFYFVSILLLHFLESVLAFPSVERPNTFTTSANCVNISLVATGNTITPHYFVLILKSYANIYLLGHLRKPSNISTRESMCIAVNPAFQTRLILSPTNQHCDYQIRTFTSPDCHAGDDTIVKREPFNFLKNVVLNRRHSVCGFRLLSWANYFANVTLVDVRGQQHSYSFSQPHCVNLCSSTGEETILPTRVTVRNINGTITYSGDFQLQFYSEVGCPESALVRKIAVGEEEIAIQLHTSSFNKRVKSFWVEHNDIE